jgi:hypothetical protein
MTYGNGDGVSYSYDLFDRLIKTEYADTGEEIHYIYNAEGELAKLERRSSADALLESYTFEYDSLGRLIRSTQLGINGNPVQRTQHLYDTANRLSTQTWTIRNSTFSESYDYDDGDGSLTKLTLSTQEGDDPAVEESINYTYDVLKRLSRATVYNKRTITAYRLEVTIMLVKNQFVVVLLLFFLSFFVVRNMLWGIKELYLSKSERKRRTKGQTFIAWFTYSRYWEEIPKVLIWLYFSIVIVHPFALICILLAMRIAALAAITSVFTYSIIIFDAMWIIITGFLSWKPGSNRVHYEQWIIKSKKSKRK